MHDHDAPAAWGHRLLQFGVLLFLVGLLTGFVIPALANPRMALASHLEGIMNGLFLIALGLIWPRLVLGRGALGAIYGFALYGTFVNWAATLLAALWGAGAPMMPIAAGARSGSAMQESVLMIMLITLSVAMVVVCVLVLVGLRRR
jgi:hydroxylaminobenzene mutase